MATLRNRLFVQGVLLGAAAGVIVGTVVAFQIVDRASDSIKKAWVSVRGAKEPDRRYIVP